MGHRQGWTRGWLAVVAVCMAPTLAEAHSLNVDCRTTSDALEVIVSFGRSKRPASGAAVEVRDAGGAIVARGQTAPDGVCRLGRPTAGKYRVSVEAHEHETEVDVVVPEVESQAGGELSTARPPQPAWKVWIPVGVFAVLGVVLVVCWRLRPRKTGSAADSPGPPRAATPETSVGEGGGGV
jgi:hypothetical protein